MQYLYVLTSTPNDNYYEQFLLSAFSLRKVMPDAQITLLCDSQTKETLTGSRSLYQNIISNIVCVPAPDNFKQIEVSRWLKTSMRSNVKGDFLFIDSDTIITEDLSSVSDLNINFGACLDKHLLLNDHPKTRDIIKNDKKLKFNSYKSNKHFNSGIIYSKDTPQINKIFDHWHELWLYSESKNIQRDQPSFNMAIQENLQYFTELDGIWNCQIAYNGLPYLANSKIIHYFATDLFSGESPYLLASDKILNKITETGTVPEEALRLLENPRAAFSKQIRITTGIALDVINTNYFESILFIKRKLPLLFSILNGTVSFLKNTLKKLTPKSIKHYN